MKNLRLKKDLIFFGRNYYFLIINFFILVGIIYKIYNFEYTIVQGKVIERIGDNMPIKENIFNSGIPLDKKKIIAVKGKLKPTGNEPRIKIKNINSTLYETNSNDQGYFRMRLRKGIYTFFIVFEDEGYLNKFDKSGDFKSLNINKDKEKIYLIYDRNLLN